MIPYWVRHYVTFCDKVIVYVDTDTDDATAILAQGEGAEVRSYVGGSGLDDMAFIAFAEEHYREARGHADWVIWTDADEILYHPRMEQRLRELRSQGVNVPRTAGFGMTANAPPTTSGQIYEEIQAGFQADNYAKIAIFDPRLNLHWDTGKHNASADGEWRRDDGTDPLRLLHYRWLGRDYFLERNRRNFSRVNPANRAMQHGRETYPGFRGAYSPEWYAEQVLMAKVCV
jgi:hypothetical protein